MANDSCVVSPSPMSLVWAENQNQAYVMATFFSQAAAKQQQQQRQDMAMDSDWVWELGLRTGPMPALAYRRFFAFQRLLQFMCINDKSTVIYDQQPQRNLATLVGQLAKM
ncbi:hypothetical protein ACLKA6_006338 [Drosophila palustris]